MNRLRLYLLTLFFATTQLTFVAAEDLTEDIPFRFGYPLYDPNYRIAPLTGGDNFTLDTLQRATLNLEHSGDLLSCNNNFFHHDLVTSGRTVNLTSLGAVPRTTRLNWHGRPFRNVITGMPKFALFPLHRVGGVVSSRWGAVSGITAPGAVIEFLPLDVRYSDPITTLYHRDGYYDYRPVEFLHSQRLAPNTFGSFGGGYYASQGRYYHANQDDRSYYTEFIHYPNPCNRFTLSYMDFARRAEIPFTVIKEKSERSDLDLLWNYAPDSIGRYEVNFFRTESQNGWDDTDDYGREFGISARAEYGGWGSYLRVNRIDGRIVGDTNFGLFEIEGSAAHRQSFGSGSIWTSLGLTGYYPDRLKPVGAFEIRYDFPTVGVVFIRVNQAADPHSPEMLYAEYRDDRPHNDLEPAWVTNPRLPIVGRKLPVSLTRGGQIGMTRALLYGEIDLSYFGSITSNQTVWGVNGDSMITPIGMDWQRVAGWSASWNWSADPYRVSASIIGINSEFSLKQLEQYMITEPPVRLQCEVGWHESFWNGIFETDILFSGKYYSAFNAVGMTGIEEIGGAYPLDFRFTGRIKRFTLFYGVHNWNSYQYYLVPDYKMIHKEEYWGINWMLLN